jgi:hypothetical protein
MGKMIVALMILLVTGITAAADSRPRGAVPAAIECALLAGFGDLLEANRLNNYAKSILYDLGLEDSFDTLQLEAAKRISNFLVPLVRSAPLDDLQVHYYRIRLAEFERRGCRALGR